MTSFEIKSATTSVQDQNSNQSRLTEQQGIEWEVAYDATISLYTHPRQLAALAIMRGYSPPPIETARILELGCATGGNLTPIALSLPESECIGIDPFEEQIHDARTRAKLVGAHNVTYLPIGVSDLKELSGSFDYIIAHGLFSWISDQHRKDTLKLFQTLLSPQGIGYISYNTYPHWHVEQVTRELLRWQHRLLTDPINQSGEYSSQELIDESRKLLQVFAQYSMGNAKQILKNIYEISSKRLKHLPDWYIVHEYLLEHNQAFYFRDWIELITQSNLQYIGDAAPNADLSFSLISNDLRRELSFAKHHKVELEQGLDLLLNRSLRRSIICHIQTEPQFTNPIINETTLINPWTHSRLTSSHLYDELFVASPYLVKGSLSDLNDQAEYYNVVSQNHSVYQCRDLYQNALLLLAGSAWPQQLSLKTLLSQAETLVNDFGYWRRGSAEELSGAFHYLLGHDLILSPTWGKLTNALERSDQHLPSLYPYVRTTLQKWPQNFSNIHHIPSFVSQDLHWLISHWEVEDSLIDLENKLKHSPHSSNLNELLRELELLGLLNSSLNL